MFSDSTVLMDSSQSPDPLTELETCEKSTYSLSTFRHLILHNWYMAMNRQKDIAVLRDFGDQVRSLRLKRRMSQEVLAEQAGLHRTYIGSIERGQRNIALLNLLRLADALHVDVATLLKGLL